MELRGLDGEPIANVAVAWAVEPPAAAAVPAETATGGAGRASVVPVLAADAPASITVTATPVDRDADVEGAPVRFSVRVSTCARFDCEGGCPGGFTCCNGTCTDLETSLAGCGACGRACRTDQACIGGVCVDFDTSRCSDRASCGTSAAQIVDCTALPDPGDGFRNECCWGTCMVRPFPAGPEGPCGAPLEPPACDAGWQACSYSRGDFCRPTCLETDLDVFACGACGDFCLADQACCGGECVDRDDPEHCGAQSWACGGAVACAAGEACCLSTPALGGLYECQ